MNIHEYQAKELLKKYGAPVSNGVVIFRLEDISNKINQLNTKQFVLKAQIHAGGRGKAGGVKLVKNLDELRKEAQEIIGHAREAGDKLKQKFEEDGKNQYNELLEKAKEHIETEKKKALGEIKTAVIEIAIKASEKVIKRNLNDEDNKKMIEQTVEEFKQQN